MGALNFSRGHSAAFSSREVAGASALIKPAAIYQMVHRSSEFPRPSRLLESQLDPGTPFSCSPSCAASPPVVLPPFLLQQGIPPRLLSFVFAAPSAASQGLLTFRFGGCSQCSMTL